MLVLSGQLLSRAVWANTAMSVALRSPAEMLKATI